MGKFYEYWENKLSGIDYMYPSMAIEEVEKYLEKSPNDFSANYYLANMFLLIGKINEAKEIAFKATEKLDKKYKAEDERNTILKISLCKIKIRLYIIAGKYKEAKKELNNYYFLMDYYKHETKYASEGTARYFINYKLGYPKKNNNYYNNQLYKYSKKESLKHIKDRHYEGGIETKDVYFYSYVNVDRLFEIINENLDKAKRYYIGFDVEICYFKLKDVGFKQTRKADFIAVKLIYGTDKIITAYPVVNIGELEYIDISEYKNELINDPTKFHRSTRIDKFNSKYGL